MKRLSYFIFALLLFASVKMHAIDATLSYNIFYSPAAGPYVETCLLIDAVSLKYQKADNGSYIGQVNVTTMFKKGDEVVNFSKIRLDSPPQSELEKSPFFMDFQRFSLPKGSYDMVVTISDAADPDKEHTHEGRITVGFEPNTIGISSIELLQSYEKITDESKASKLAKNGYEIVPKVTGFYHKDDNSLPFYCEIYNADSIVGKDTPLLVRSFVRSFETKQQMSDLASFKRIQASDIYILLSKFDITSLPSGNYEMCVEVRDRANSLLTESTIFFQRSNPDLKLEMREISESSYDGVFTRQLADLEQLRDLVYALVPKATYLEKEFIQHQAKTADLTTLQTFMYSFWLERDELNPERAWLEYYELVKIVNGAYSHGRTRGYNTDRGRVYLQYGPPSVIVDRAFDTGDSGSSQGAAYNGGGTVPYQIWHYEVLDNQKDKRFVFANKHIAADTYELIHSDARGELFNPQWQVELSRDRYSPSLLDSDGKIFEGRTGDYYMVPY